MRLIWLAIYMWVLGGSVAHAAENIDFLTYHDAPPFIVNKARQDGLTYDLAIFLTVASEGRYRFNVKILPRMRLNQVVRRSNNCVVPWVNPAWFRGAHQYPYYWSESYLVDRNVFISKKSLPLVFQQEKDLYGKKLAGLHGGKWIGLEPAVSQGRIKRLSTHSYEAIVQMVLAGRVAAGVLPESVNSYFLHNDRLLKDQVYVSEYPQSDYARHFLTCQRADVAAYLDKMVPILLQDERWRKLVGFYGLLLPEMSDKAQ